MLKSTIVLHYDRKLFCLDNHLSIIMFRNIIITARTACLFILVMINIVSVDLRMLARGVFR